MVIVCDNGYQVICLFKDAIKQIRNQSQWPGMGGPRLLPKGPWLPILGISQIFSKNALKKHGKISQWINCFLCKQECLLDFEILVPVWKPAMTRDPVSKGEWLKKIHEACLQSSQYVQMGECTCIDHTQHTQECSNKWGFDRSSPYSQTQRRLALLYNTEDEVLICEPAMKDVLSQTYQSTQYDAPMVKNNTIEPFKRWLRDT